MNSSVAASSDELSKKLYRAPENCIFCALFTAFRKNAGFSYLLKLMYYDLLLPFVTSYYYETFYSGKIDCILFSD